MKEANIFIFCFSQNFHSCFLCLYCFSVCPASSKARAHFFQLLVSLLTITGVNTAHWWPFFFTNCQWVVAFLRYFYGITHRAPRPRRGALCLSFSHSRHVARPPLVDLRTWCPNLIAIKPGRRSLNRTSMDVRRARGAIKDPSGAKSGDVTA